jgi:hypothetical protein
MKEGTRKTIGRTNKMSGKGIREEGGREVNMWKYVRDAPFNYKRSLYWYDRMN